MKLAMLIKRNEYCEEEKTEGELTVIHADLKPTNTLTFEHSTDQQNG